MDKQPEHLSADAGRWFESVLRDYELDEHHLRLLTLAGECWDEGEAARKAIAKSGMTYVDRFGSPKARPEIAIARDARIGFARLIRELGLDSGNLPVVSRPYALSANSGRKSVAV